jgi:hypothetical protein
MTLCNVVVGYQRFGGPYCLHLQGEVKMMAEWSSETFKVVFWVVMPCSAMVGYQRFRGPYCLHLEGEVKMKAEFHDVTTQQTIIWFKILLL